MNERLKNDDLEESCVLIGVISNGLDHQTAQEHIEELEFLARTAGAHTKKTFLQSLPFPNPKTYVGSGKLDEVREYIRANNIGTVIFDDELSPSQLRNVERSLECKIIDRTILILDIFASRARTHQAKTQVELAQLQYMLPRLTRMWTHLERQKGGIGLRGPGESQIETDRRIITQRISLLKDRLKSIDKQNATQRGNRGQLVRAALVGYTNVGKSTIMNMLSKSDVFAENKLFATLDTTVRKVVIGNLPLLLTDTVGFIRKLPKQLLDSFKSTLDEVREADILIHVLDVSHPSFEEHFVVVNETLNEIDQREKPSIIVFNKIDVYKPEEMLFTGEEDSLDHLRKTWMARMKNKTHCIFISAENKTNIDEFKNILYQEVREIFKIRYPYNNFLY